MRPRVPLGFRLRLTDCSLFQVCTGSGFSLMFRMYVCNFLYILWIIGVGKSWRGRLVEWVEKARLEKIRRLLEIFERERHYKVFLT